MAENMNSNTLAEAGLSSESTPNPTTYSGEDKVIAEYDLYITPEREEQLFLLQYINRPNDQKFNRACNSKPLQLRIKPKSGFVEIEVPQVTLDPKGYDRAKGVRWGEALRKSKAKGQKGWGFASGFQNVKPPPPPPKKTNAPPQPQGPTELEEEEMIRDYINEFEDAAEKGHVLTTQTLGGQIAPESQQNSTYMVAVFRDSMFFNTSPSFCASLRFF